MGLARLPNARAKSWRSFAAVQKAVNSGGWAVRLRHRVGDLANVEKSIPTRNSPPVPVKMTILFARSHTLGVSSQPEAAAVEKINGANHLILQDEENSLSESPRHPPEF